MKNKNIIFTLLFCSIACLHYAQGGWFGWGKKVDTSSQDRKLMEAIERNDYSLAVRAMEAGVNPNAKVDGETSLFIQAFRHAIEYDENGDISGINSQASDIARHLANLGGDLTALDKELTEYLDVAGVPQLRKFASARAAIAFKTFVKHLKNIGAAAKG